MMRLTKTSMDRVKSWQNKHTSFMDLGLKHVQNKGMQPRHVKASKRHYKATMLSMHKGPKLT